VPRPTTARCPPGATAIERRGHHIAPALVDVPQDEHRGDARIGHHEQRDRRSERDVAALDAELERPGGETVGQVDRPARGEDADDVEVREGDDEREQRRDGDDVSASSAG
jgi:hypothetical protein